MKPLLLALASSKVPLMRLNCTDPPRERVGKERKLRQRKKKEIIWVHTSGMRGKRWRGSDKQADEEETEKYLQDRDVSEDKNSLQAAN